MQDSLWNSKNNNDRTQKNTIIHEQWGLFDPIYFIIRQVELKVELVSDGGRPKKLKQLTKILVAIFK